MHQKLIRCLALALTLSQLLMPATGESYEVGINNVSALIDSNSLVLLLFYSNRCKYSVQLMPIYDTAADLLHAKLGGDGKIALGKVNCDKEPEMEENYDIGKYPTIKIVRDQYIDKNEYRGQRSVSAIMTYAIMEMQDPIQEFASFNDLLNLETQKYLVIGHYENKSHIEYEVYRRVASLLKEHCQFHVNFNSTHAPSSLTFRPHINDTESVSQFIGNLSDHKNLLSWMTEKCIPIVRKLTFTNAEEITEEGKPLAILFHHPADSKSVKDFEKVVNAELLDELENVNFLTADGKLFANPVFHLNKTEEELPFIAIDSFAHMFPFPKYDDIHTPGKLKEFITSLNTGNLHFNYHFSEFLESDDESPDVDELLISSLPPASKFKELRPSKHRYTFVRDELSFP